MRVHTYYSDQNSWGSYILVRKVDDFETISLDKIWNTILVATNQDVGQFSSLNRENPELEGKGHEPSRAENCSARALAQPSLARTHH